MVAEGKIDAKDLAGVLVTDDPARVAEEVVRRRRERQAHLQLP